MKKAILALADGTVFHGRALGCEGETTGEVVFNTAMTGYQEVLTDPSYKGQIVTMTCPHIGNYGIPEEDVESHRVWAEGFVVTEACPNPSNWRSERTLDEFLRGAKVVGIDAVDTRALTRHLREHGSQQALISHVELDPVRAVEKARRAPGILGRDLVKEVTCAEPYAWTEGSGTWPPDGRLPHGRVHAKTNSRSFHVVVYDLGVKHNILRRLVDVGCRVTVVPAATLPAQVEALQPDGIFLSNGPGDPEGVPYASASARHFVGKRPMMGICLGHQMLGLASGLRTYKLKFGHHGANHPVMDLRTRKVEITSQNHNFAVEAPVEDSAAKGAAIIETALGRMQVSHVSLNDRSVEGFVALDHPVFSVQYHPEASPGPHDACYLFDEFVQLMEKHYA
ncbi:carbamoyl-phosphate synthase small chain [Nitrospira sp.]|nr:carbamoyl-phosphate synthase small chain [Nitrospira sp.]